MFPNSQDGPTVLSQTPADSAVATAIALDLPIPVRYIRTWRTLAFGTAMPEAAIHENGEALQRKNEIGLTGQILDI